MTNATNKSPEDMLNDALRLVNDAYQAHVRELAEELVGESRDNPDEDRDWVLERLHESIDGDGWVIYTAKAQAVVLCSSNDGAYLDAYGSDGVVEHGQINWSRLAYAALEQDVIEALPSDFDINAEYPGRVEADEEAEAL